MTVKERLHQMIDGLPEAEAEKLMKRIENDQTVLSVKVPSETGGEDLTSWTEEETPEQDEAVGEEAIRQGYEEFCQFIEKAQQQIPEEDWKRLPPDLSDNLDHYLYGLPKK